MPVVTMIAGPNGSGKSTLTRLLADRGIEFGAYMNADDIATTLVGKPEEVSALAQQKVRDARNTAQKQGRDYCFETVMSHRSHIDHLIEARRRGFYVRLFFVATDHPEISVARVSNRVLHGGHDVPADRIRARYSRCLANLPAAIAVAHGGCIYDNSDTDNPFRQIAVVIEGVAATGQSAMDEPVLSQANLESLPVWWLEYLVASKPSPLLIGQNS